MQIDRIIRVDMTTKIISEETSPERYALLGGRALGATMLLEETDARVHPLSREAKLFLCSANTGVDLYSIRYVYAMSKRTEVNFGYAKVNNESAARYQLGGLNANGAGQDPSAFALNMTHSF